MFRKLIYKRFFPVVFATVLCIIGMNAFTLSFAQGDISDSAIVDIPFNSGLDNRSVLPEDLGQIDSPLGEGSRVIIGRDERYPVLSRQSPWATMGRLEWRDRGQVTSTCTATLIGPSSILTNSHCLTYLRYNESTQDFDEYFITPDRYSRLLSLDDGQSKMVFKANMIEGQSLDEANVISFEAGWSVEDQNAVDDWAVLKLDKPIGNDYGYMGWRYLDFTDPDVVSAVFEKIYLLGYAGDFPTERMREFGNPTETAGVDVACSIVGVWPQGSPYEGTLAHDCDTNPGASGGPIFAKFSDEQYYLVGLHSRSTPISTATLPNGVVTNVINGGVQLSRWSAAAASSRW